MRKDGLEKETACMATKAAKATKATHVFNFRKYFEKNYSDICDNILVNNDKIKNLFETIVKNKLAVEIENKRIKSDFYVISNDDFTFKNVNEIRDFFNNCENAKQEYKNISYFAIENENYIIAINNFYLNKKYLPEKLENRRADIEKYKFYSSRKEVNKIYSKLHFLLDNATGSDELFSDLIGYIVNDKNIYYCLIIDKRNHENTFVVFKDYYLSVNNVGYCKKEEVVFFNLHVVFPARIENATNNKINYIGLTNVLADKTKEKKSRKWFSMILLNLNNFVGFNYFDAVKVLPEMINSVENINEFNFSNMENLKTIIFSKKGDTDEISFTKENYVYLMKMDNEQYSKFLVVKDIADNYYDIRIDVFKNFKFTWFLYDIFYITNFESHKIYGPSHIRIIYKENKPDYNNAGNKVEFCIDDVRYSLDNYITKLASKINEKELMKFALTYLN